MEPINLNHNLKAHDLERALEDEIFYQALSLSYKQGRQDVLSRDQAIEKFYREFPDMRRLVVNHVANGTCLKAIKEFRDLRKEQRRRGQETIAAREANLPPREPTFISQFKAPLPTIPELKRPLPPPPWGIPDEDLERLLEAYSEAPTKAVTSPTRRGSPQSEAARQLLLKTYPEGVPESSIPYKTLSSKSGISKTVLVGAAKKMRKQTSKLRSE